MQIACRGHIECRCDRASAPAAADGRSPASAGVRALDSGLVPAMIRRMQQALLLQHDELYPAGRFSTILRDFGVPTELIQLHRGQALPGDLSEVRLIVLLGGSMRVSDAESGKHPFFQREIEIARQFIERDRAIVGVGFGAELLSHAGGGKVSENRKPGPPPASPGEPAPPGELAPEYGFVPMNFPFPGGTEPAVFGMADGTPFFNWHRDTFAPPALPPPANPPPPPARPPTGNVVMAASRACRTQAYRFKNRVLGFQFHLELEKPHIEAIIARRGPEAGLSVEEIGRLKADVQQHYARYDRSAAKLIQNLVQFLKAY